MCGKICMTELLVYFIIFFNRVLQRIKTLLDKLVEIERTRLWRTVAPPRDYVVSVAAKNKFTKTRIFGVQGRSRSSMLVPLESSSGVLAMICSKSVSICNRFHAR